MMMTGVTAPAIAPGAMESGPGVSMAAVEESGKKGSDKGRDEKGGMRKDRGEGREEGSGGGRKEGGRGRRKVGVGGREEESNNKQV